MSEARNQLERLFGGPAPAPAVAPPKVKPAIRPAPDRTRPDPRHPNPWRRREMKPGEVERPRAMAALRREAQAFMQANDLGELV